MKVLVAEDNPINRMVVEQMLAALGIEPTFAASGRQAVELWREIRPKLVLMDIFMPEMDGLEATRHIRALERTGGERTRILGVTASAAAADRQRCLEAGMDGHLAKPFSLDDLAAALAALVGDAVGSAARPASAGPVDPQRLHDLVGHLSADEAREILSTSLAEIDLVVTAIEAASRAGDWEALAGRAAELDVLAQPLGLRAVVECCEALVAAGGAGDAEAVRVASAGLAGTVAEARAAVEAWSAPGPSS